MDAVFLKILNMGITASWLILAVIILRLALKKAPKAIICVLWTIVAIRLICPFSFESAFSLIPSTETVSQDMLYSQTPGITSGIPAINSVVNPLITGSLAPEAGASVNPLQIWTIIASCIWLVGIAVMLGYAIVSYLRIKKKVREGTPLRDNIWLCDHIDTPFILGVLRPRIYLPSAMGDAQSDYVVAHENAHLKRHDHWWKPLGFFLLAIYWFNPLCWLAYALLCRDIEAACDEKVVKDWAAHDKKAYSEALLKCSVPHKLISACPLAFGEVGVKQRVKNVLNYKKLAFWVIVTAVAACLVVAVCFLTDPVDNDLSLLNYKNAASVAAQTDTVTAVRVTNMDNYGDGDAFTSVISGRALAEYLYGADWTHRRLPPVGAEQEGSVSFIIDDGYTVSIMQGKKLAHVALDGESRYYRIQSGDFEDAMKLSGNAEQSADLDRDGVDETLDVVAAMRAVSASDFKNPGDYGNVTAEQLAGALRAAAEKRVTNTAAIEADPANVYTFWSIR
ncbi:MAG: M56 family metallopeptidase, partial [Bacillota bacterium]|nr:M56 family metallopeptidase [Bacillota bacterium]